MITVPPCEMTDVSSSIAVAKRPVFVPHVHRWSEECTVKLF